MTMKEIWEAVIASWTIDDKKLTEVKLYPISLGYGMPWPQMGLPKLSGDEDFLRRMADLSKPYGTEMEIKDGVATIKLQ